MHTDLCDRLDIEFPIFAFTHCRDVVVAVSQAGGFGVLGAVGFTPEQLEIELRWIDEHVGDNPYGVDFVIPGKYEGKSTGETDPKKLEEMLKKMIPEQHRAFARKILADHSVPSCPPTRSAARAARLDRGHRDAADRSDAEAPEGEADRERARHATQGRDRPHPRIGPAGVALCGRADQALKHKAAGVDIIIAQGTEGGGTHR
jgi:NAD(P)H-dependent flavin oxidoreductase YrpB (nitropropane dioxygenase family)